MNVIKSEDFLVLINLLARDFPGNNLAKNAIWVRPRIIPRRIRKKIWSINAILKLSTARGRR